MPSSGLCRVDIAECMSGLVEALDVLAGSALGCPAFSGLLNLRSLCGELRIQVFGADFAWCPVAECGVNSSLIVEQFDVAGNVLLRFLPCRIHDVMHSLVLQAGEKRFRQRIIPTLTGPPDRMPQPKPNQGRPIFGRRVLRTAVGMHNTIRFEPMIPHGHVQRVGDQFGPQVVGHGPADHLAVETITIRLAPIMPAITRRRRWKRRLLELVDFRLVNQCRPRLTVGAAHVRTSQMRYFDSRDGEIGVKHIMASGALPPAFPAVRIDGELYWDGGILSNTPTEAMFDDNPRKNSLIFAVHLWNPTAQSRPRSGRCSSSKGHPVSSRIASHIARQQQTHRLRQSSTSSRKLPEAERAASGEALAAYGCPTRCTSCGCSPRSSSNENHTKDIDFSPSGIMQRWEAGYRHTKAVLEKKPWDGEFDPLSGVVLDEQMEVMPEAAE